MPVALIVKADEPALFFSSIKDAERYLEAIDVRDGVYAAAYGPNGEPYALRTHGDRVAIEPLAGELRAEELQALLTSFLAAIGADTSGELSDLVRACEKHVIA